MEREILLEKYLMNDLNEAEWHQFEAYINNDEDFKDEVEIRSILYADYKTDLKKELLKSRPVVSIKPISKIRLLLKPALQMAALLVLGLAALLLFQINSSNRLDTLTSQYINESPPNPTSLRGEINSYNLDAAIEAYQNQQYDLAAQLFGTIEQPSNLQYFYLGLSYLYQEPRVSLHIQKAIQNFEKVIETPNNFTEEALWYISLSYLLDAQHAQARNYLKQIKKSSINYEKASLLLKILIKSDRLAGW